MRLDGLNDRESAFVLELTRNPFRPAGEAYIAAGYAARHARRNVHKLMRKPVLAAL